MAAGDRWIFAKPGPGTADARFGPSVIAIVTIRTSLPQDPGPATMPSATNGGDDRCPP